MNSLLGLFVLLYLYIVQAWADWRCLSFSEGQCESLNVGISRRGSYAFLVFFLYLIIYSLIREPISVEESSGMHIGNLIKQQLEEQGRSVVWFARKLSYSRTNVYKIFEKPSIDTNLLLRISSILNYDFFKYYTEYFRDAEQ